MCNGNGLGKRALVALLVFCTLGCATAVLAAPELRILLYHRVGDDRYPTTNVPMDGFRQQMQYLADEGYTVVRTREVEAFLLEGKALPDKAVAIQFDDGFRTVYDNAFPILKEFNYPFAIFIPTRHLEKKFGDYMSWEMVDEVAAWGAEIGAHSNSHPRLGTRGADQSEAAYRDQINAELKKGAEILTKRGHKPRWYAYPYGEYNPEIVKLTGEAGYALGFAQDPGAVGAATDPFRISRFAVVGGVSDFDTFRARLRYGALGFAEQLPVQGVLEDAAPAVYRARILNPERYLGGEVNLFVSELGRLEASFDPVTGVIEAKGGKKLSRRLNRVQISVKEKGTGRYALGGWMILKP